MGPEALAQVLRPLANFLPADRASSLLAGMAEGDDAAVYRLNDGQCLIFTVDFFTPVVDDPYDFGAIAAANAMSDVYATGGEPILALNLAAFPPDLSPAVMEAIFKGGAEKAYEANCALAGGHTITDREPKYGMAVIGLARPEDLLLKSGARPGDALVLTKRLGTGALTTAAKNDACPAGMLEPAIASMKRLNRDALHSLRRHGARACTDVTGFAFAGHALELADKGRVALRIYAGSLPYFDGAYDMVAKGQLPGGALRNRAFYEPKLRFEDGMDGTFKALFFMPETSGGLLAAIPAEEAQACLRDMRERGLDAALVGDVIEDLGGPAMYVAGGKRPAG
jgi:selenide,water dikinase